MPPVCSYQNTWLCGSEELILPYINQRCHHKILQSITIPIMVFSLLYINITKSTTGIYSFLAMEQLFFSLPFLSLHETPSYTDVGIASYRCSPISLDTVCECRNHSDCPYGWQGLPTWLAQLLLCLLCGGEKNLKAICLTCVTVSLIIDFRTATANFELPMCMVL